MRLGGGALVLLLVMLLFGVDPSVLLQVLEGGVPTAEVPAEGPAAPAPAGGPADELADFVSVVLADTEDTWSELFARAGSRYQPPRLVLFSDAVRSGCGVAGSAVGPFYCALDQKVYIDLAFYRDLRDRFRAPGDFAQAYVIAHEVGHHVQNLTGTSDQVHDLRGRVSEREGNALSVRLELQADCYAGVWAHHADRTRQLLEQGDVEEGLAAAAAIGDDRIQRQTQGQVVPESFTHGSSEQRVRWFRTGLQSGSVESCDTFGAGSL
jgi:predicted metalloprotease